ncbi:uncharacterized protein LOC142224055 [Haematobia irritans]|uniref:uncharacterized protein LOC142224055 n=1 Tax=Haematobia irritans TaxID=7368 RepID=UPI003F50A6A2
MICIGGDVYCRKIIYEMALSSTQKASRIARKLLEGVFKKDFLLKATLTGQSPRAQGLERQQEPVIPLCYKARAAIIDFSIRLAQQRGWEPQNLKEIERAMSQRLGEIKRQKYLQISPLIRNSDEQIQLPPNFDRW